jgi:hypothetical protein
MATSDEPTPEPPDLRPARRSKKEFLRILRRAGYPDETIQAVNAQFGDYIHYERDADALAKLSISTGAIEDRFDSSP